MGRKSRAKRQRSGDRAQAALADRKTRNRRVALLVTGGLAVVLIGAVAAIVLASRPAAVGLAAPGAAQTTESRDALETAAAAIRFRPSQSPGVGLVENMPADTPTGATSPTLLSVGSQAPDFTLQSPTGETVRLSDHRGKTVLLEFFATWCPHCQAEAPHLARIHANLDPEHYAILSVNGNSEDAASVHAYDLYYRLPFPALLDPGGTPGSYYQSGGAGIVSRAYRIAVFPTFYIIGPDGRVAWRGDSEQPNALLLRELQRASGK